MSESCENRNKPKSFKQLIHSWYFWKPAIAIILGGILGFLYYTFYGCTSGGCSITGNPFGSIILGAIFGYFVVNSPCISGKCY